MSTREDWLQYDLQVFCFFRCLDMSCISSSGKSALAGCMPFWNFRNAVPPCPDCQKRTWKYQTGCIPFLMNSNALFKGPVWKASKRSIVIVVQGSGLLQAPNPKTKKHICHPKVPCPGWFRGEMLRLFYPLRWKPHIKKTTLDTVDAFRTMCLECTLYTLRITQNILWHKLS